MRVHMRFPCVWNEFRRPAQERGGRCRVTTFVRLCEDGGRRSCAVLGRRGVGARPSPRYRSGGGAVLPTPGGGRPRPGELCAKGERRTGESGAAAAPRCCSTEGVGSGCAGASVMTPPLTCTRGGDLCSCHWAGRPSTAYT